jgi:hypothetical protein
MTDIVINLDNQEWYQALLEELAACMVETEFSSRWTLIEGYHKVGIEILAHEDKFTQAGYLKASETIAQALGKSQRQIEQCIQFARKYPDLSLMNTGKNISWHKITQELLPEHVEPISKPVTKAELIQIIKDIKNLLQHELDDSNSEYISYQKTEDEIDLIKSQEKINCIRYLQDQIEKITQDNV